MPDRNGFEVMEFIRNEGIDTLPLVLTGYASVESAIRAMKLGAYDFIQNPSTRKRSSSSSTGRPSVLFYSARTNAHMLELRKLNDSRTVPLGGITRSAHPLSSIGGYANYLLRRGSSRNTQRSYLLIIREIADNLYSLVNELLDVSRIEAGVKRLTMEESTWPTLVSTSINNFPARLRPKHGHPFPTALTTRVR